MAGHRIIGGLTAVCLAFSLVLAGGCGKTQKTEAPQEMYGVVDLETLVKAHPSYTEYFRLQTEYEDLLNHYQAEQKKMLHLTSAQKKLKEALISSDVQKAADEEYKARVRIRENELNQKLQKLYAEIENRHNAQPGQPVMAGGGGEDNTQIANLHLKLKFLGMNGEEKTQTKQALQDLLNKRYAEIPQDHWTEEEKKEFMEKRTAAKAELDAYAAQVAEEIHERQRQSLQAAGSVNLPDADSWNSQWEERVKAKQKEMAAVKEIIMNDIREKAAVIGEKKHLDIIFTSYRANISAEDVTSDIVNELVQGT